MAAWHRGGGTAAIENANIPENTLTEGPVWEERRTANSQQGQPEQKLCGTCGKPLTYISVYNAWYCYTCQKYGILPPEYQQPAQTAAQPRGTGDGASAQAAQPAAVGRCVTCGAPLSATGECNHCIARELLAAIEKESADAAAKGVELRRTEGLVRQARASFDEGNFGDARSQAEKARALIRELEVQFNQAREQLAEAERVVADFRNREVDVGQSESLIQLAHSFLKTGNYEKAIAYSKKAVKTANEAQTRTVAERALEEKAPLPPAVARPVDEGAAPAPAKAAPEQVPRTPVRIVPQPDTVSSPAATPTAAPAVSPPPGAKDPEYLAAEKEIREVEAELEALEKSGESVTHARNLLKLSLSFLRGGSYEKATRYARKVKNVIEERKLEGKKAG
ncbi:MAG: hypothetical protein QXH42_07855 [Thermoplasmata archaeon]